MNNLHDPKFQHMLLHLQHEKDSLSAAQGEAGDGIRLHIFAGKQSTFQGSSADSLYSHKSIIGLYTLRYTILLPDFLFPCRVQEESRS